MANKWKPKERAFMPFFFSWRRTFAEIPDTDAMEIIFAALDYAEHGIEPQLAGYKAAIFETMRPNIDANIERYNRLCETNRIKARARWHGAEDVTGCHGMPRDAEGCRVMPSDARYAKEKEKDKEKDKDNNARARARDQNAPVKRGRSAWDTIERHEYTDEDIERIERAGRDDGEQDRATAAGP